MVDYLKYYAPVLTRAVEICNQIITFFNKHQISKDDRFGKAELETITVRNGILGRMKNPKYLSINAFNDSILSGFVAFYDNHATNDYGVSLPADELAIRDQLMTAWIKEVVEPLTQLMNELEER